MALGNSFCLILTLPELIDEYKKHYKVRTSQNLNDKAAALFNSSVCVGSIIGPLLGGFLNDKFGYRMTNDLMAIFIGVYSIIYILFNFKMGSLRRNQREKYFILPINEDFKL